KLPPSLFTLINDKYYYVANSIDFTNISYARMIIFMFPVLYFWKTIYTTFSTRKNLLFLYLVVIVNIAFSAYSGSMYVLFGRGSYYMYMPFIFFIGKCVNLQTVPTKKNIHYIIFILYAFLAFIYLIYRENYNDVFPFVVDPLISI